MSAPDIDRLSLDDDDLQAKHRKERKELQSKIQALKKSADKGDKKRKREVLDEIAKLELALEQRQQSELNALNGDQAKEVESIVDKPAAFIKVDNESQVGGGDRVSKAQKRRDKKAQAEREKQVEIAAQEELNKNGPRMLELQNLNKVLQKRVLVLHTIPSDGDCLYNAVAHQLVNAGYPPKDVSTLRGLAADYILANKDSLIFYMTNPRNGDILTDEEFVEYCHAVRNTPAWGGQIEIKALSNSLRVPIEVLQASGPPTVQNEHNVKGASLIITYHRFMYSLGEHYNSTKAACNKDSSPDDPQTISHWKHTKKIETQKIITTPEST